MTYRRQFKPFPSLKMMGARYDNNCKFRVGKINDLAAGDLRDFPTGYLPAVGLRQGKRKK